MSALLDVVVVGGGPVGLATAIALRGQGLGVAVLEAATPPLDKACGEGLMPDGVAALAQLGIAAAPLGAPFAGISFRDADGRTATARFASGTGCGIRRIDLHGALAARAAAVGVDLRWGVRVTGLLTGTLAEAGATADGEYAGAGITTAAGEVRARFVVAADGLRSPLRAMAGLATDPPSPRASRSATAAAGLRRGERPHRPALRRGDRFGLRCHFAIAPWSPWVEVHWGDGAEAYVTPVGGTADRQAQVGVALLFDRELARARAATAPPADRTAGDWPGAEPPFEALLARFPQLAERLAGVPRLSTPRGVGPLRQRVRRVARGRLALVGDAAGYVDALTGEGLGLGFQSALALAPLLAAAAAAPPPAATLEPWSAVHRRLVRWPFLLTEGLLLATRSPALRHRLIAAFARRESTFAGFLAAMAEHRPPRLGAVAGLLAGLFTPGPDAPGPDPPGPGEPGDASHATPPPEPTMHAAARPRAVR